MFYHLPLRPPPPLPLHFRGLSLPLYLHLTSLHPLAHLPPSLDFPDPNAKVLLPGFQPASSSTICSIPTNPVCLEGFDFPTPPKVVSALRANWAVHIPLTALTTRSLNNASLASQEDSGQTISVDREGKLSLVSLKISAKDEGSISAQEWIHAFSRLVEAIRRHLPGGNSEAITDTWQAHYNRLVRHPDFWDLFHVVLCYDIRLCVSYLDHNLALDPSYWQDEVWRQILDAYRTNTQHLIPGLAGITPPLPSKVPTSTPAPSGPSTATSSSTSRSFPSSSSQSSNLQNSGFWQFLQCIFCGVPGCRRRACGLTKTAFISFTNGSWQTAQGEQICFRFNGRGCSESACSRHHLCSCCGGPHTAQECRS